MESPLPFAVLTPFAYRVKGYSGGMDRHGIWEIIACGEDIGSDNERLKIRRIATARSDCPLGEVCDVSLQSIRDDAERVDWSSFLPTQYGI